MASIFTFQDEPHRVHSPWSTPGSSTPQRIPLAQDGKGSDEPQECRRCTKLEPEKHDGPTEYKLHLLLRPRRTFSFVSTTTSIPGSQQIKSDLAGSNSRSVSESSLLTASYQPSNQTRQARLQQLTTQLLWRLQQSSPFHSSSNAKLVLPVLPEATPRLGVPDRPSKLLPGLEESQGALYEIGVADDGTLVGLAEEELEESLTNLRAMASSLGCVVDVLRRVVVGKCEWFEIEEVQNTPVTKSSQLWVAEVLVRPDNKHVEVVPRIPADSMSSLDHTQDQSSENVFVDETGKEQIRVALVGASAAGKSSLLGTLTTSVLDNGRGKSRLSLLKHRHEIASGVTSSVAQELVGYRKASNTSPAAVNYASGDVSSWPDIHDLADRLVFFSDSPGLPRFAKSTFRALLSWNPAWVLLCIPADNAESDGNKSGSLVTESFAQQPSHTANADLSLAHLETCLKLGSQIVVVITKMDLASKNGLRSTLSKVLSTLKAARRVPAMLSSTSVPSSGKEESDNAMACGTATPSEQLEIEQLIYRLETEKDQSIVPIVMTSAVNGSGLGKLHTLLKSIPTSLHEQPPRHTKYQAQQVGTHAFEVDEVFAIPPSKVYSADKEVKYADSGIVLCGLAKGRTISLGDELALGPFLLDAENEAVHEAEAMRRTSSHSAKSPLQTLPRSLSETFSKSLQLESRGVQGTVADIKPTFIRVRVVSLRNLRLPVRAMQAGETGTVGVQPTNNEHNSQYLGRARKGMILTSPSEDLTAYRSFIASFPASDFGGMSSPPLILGGHAIAYVNSVRAAVKVVAVALDDGAENTFNSSPSAPIEVFSFEDDDHHRQEDEQLQARDIRITFKFVSTVEYLESGNRVLVVPTMTAAGPVAGPASSTAVTGLSGFVGRICELFT